MQKTRLNHTYVVATLFFLTLCIALVLSVLEGRARIVAQEYPYLDATRAVEERVELLLAQMTLREKIGQMALSEKYSVFDIADVTLYGLGGVLSGSGAKPDNNTPQGWRDMTEAFRAAALHSRLKIPLFYGADSNHGHGNVPGATIFPHAIGLGAAQDPVLVEKIAQATAREMLATGVNWNFAPSLDLPHDLRWGRVYEAYGDDSERVAALGAAFVRGSQSRTPGDVFVLATPKHFVGLGSMLWGSSLNSTYSIDQGVTPDDERALRTEYLPPFEAAVTSGALSIMAALNVWGETKLSASTYLLTEVLKGELGFQGFIVSDWYGVYELAPNKYDAVVLGINAGVDMVMIPFDHKEFIQNVEFAVNKGDIPLARIDDAVRRILRTKFVAGLFEATNRDEPPLSVVGSAAHRALAHEAVLRSLVLLKNENDTLPLQQGSHILVAGSGAHNAGMQMGAWTIEWQGVDGNWIPGASTILDGIQQQAGEGARVEYDRDGNFPEGTTADVGIVVVGEKPYAEGVGDTAEPSLSSEDLSAIRSVAAKSERVVVIILSGRPLLIADQVGQWNALVAAWLPGSEGAAIAEALFGTEPIRGTLPLPWPASLRQVPTTAVGDALDHTPLLYARGFGLTL